MIHAGVYAAVTHYLKALAATGADSDGKAVVDKMKELATDDPLFGKGTIRADGRKIHDMYLFEVKKPEESKGPWDYYKLRATIPAAEAFRPLDKGGCPAREVMVISRSEAGPGPLPAMAAGETVAMTELLGISPQALFGQLLIGLINGSFYALLSLGLAVIFGLLNIINFAHGALYMTGAFVAWFLLQYLGLGYWWALISRSAPRRAVRHRPGEDDAEAPARARSSLWPAAHLRTGAHHPGTVPQSVRFLGPALRHSRRNSPAASIWASCSCRSIAAG